MQQEQSQGTSQHQMEKPRPRHQCERQRPLTNNISSFIFFLRLDRSQPQRAELLAAMVLVAEALSDHSRKFTKQSLVSKQALLARGLALNYWAGPGLLR